MTNEPTDSDPGTDPVISAIRGEIPFTWAIWSSFLDGCDGLTPVGRTALARAVDTIGSCLGEGWLAKGLSRRPGPMLDGNWWGNCADHVLRRILTLACRIELMRSRPGFGFARKQVTGDPGHFHHWLIQLEVACLAIRAGWTAELEPSADRGRADLLLSRDKEAMLVEVRWFDEDAKFKADTDLSSRLMIELLRIEGDFNISFVHEFQHVPTVDEVDVILAQAQVAAEDSSRTGLIIECDISGGGRLTVHPEPGLSGHRGSMPVRQTDPLLRLRSRVEAKIAQSQGSHPLWLRFDESRFFWALPPGQPRSRLHNGLVRWLAGQLVGHQGIAGIVLTNPAVMCTSSEVLVHRSPAGALSMQQPINAPCGRELIIVPGQSHPGAEHAVEWVAWYTTEVDWLAWALEQLELPGLDDILIRREQPLPS